MDWSWGASGVPMPSTRARLIERLADRGRLTLHALEPGGVVFVSGPDFGNPQELARVRRALSLLGPEVVWVVLPNIQLDVLSAAMRAAMIEQASGMSASGEVFTAVDSSDQRITVRCPRCDDHVQMSIIVTMSDIDNRLTARSMVDPNDVDLHNLSCNGPAEN